MAHVFQAVGWLTDKKDRNGVADRLEWLDHFNCIFCQDFKDSSWQTSSPLSQTDFVDFS